MNTVKIKDYIVLGAGPAGLQLAYDMEKSEDNYLVLEAGSGAGNFFRNFPRHRKLISINKVYTGYDDKEINLRWDWNSLLSHEDDGRFSEFSKEYFPSADDMVVYLNNYAEKNNLKVKYDCKIEHIDYDKDNKFYILSSSSKDKFYCKVLIVATGVSQPYIPKIPGVEFTENYYDYQIEPKNFANQRVLIIGKGNSAFEVADSLIGAAAYIHLSSPKPLNFAWRSKYVGHLRAVNNNFLDTYQLKSQNIVINADISEIKKMKNGAFSVKFEYGDMANGEVEEIVYDRIITCTGFKFDCSIFSERIKPELVIRDRFPKQTYEWESTNVPTMYFAGTIMQMRDFKKSQSGFIHGFRYNVKFLKKILDKKYKGKPLASENLEANPMAVSEKIIERINLTSSLWQQTGYFCDVATLEGDEVIYYSDLPKDYAMQNGEIASKHKFIITLEFGKDVIARQNDTFNIKRPHKDDYDNADQGAALHPILYEYKGDKLISSHHIIEDIMSEWQEDVHIQPLIRYLTKRLKMISVHPLSPAVAEIA